MEVVCRFVPTAAGMGSVSRSICCGFYSSVHTRKCSRRALESLGTAFEGLVGLIRGGELMGRGILSCTSGVGAGGGQSCGILSGRRFSVVSRRFGGGDFCELKMGRCPGCELLFGLLFCAKVQVNRYITLACTSFRRFSCCGGDRSGPVQVIPADGDARNGRLRKVEMEVGGTCIDRVGLAGSPGGFGREAVPLSPSPRELFVEVEDRRLVGNNDLSSEVFP